MILECGRFVNGGISSIKILFDMRPGRIQTKMIEKRSYFEMILESAQIKFLSCALGKHTVNQPKVTEFLRRQT